MASSWMTKNQELQRHCEEVYMDPEETKAVEGRKMSISRGSETSNSQRAGGGLALQLASSCRQAI